MAKLQDKFFNRVIEGKLELQEGDNAVLGLKGKDVEVGSLSAEGKISGGEIVENMEGYSYTPESEPDYSTLELDYVGVCKNGNKITFALAGSITFTSAGISAGGTGIGTFTIPSSIGEKLYPTAIGNLSNLLALATVNMYTENSSIVIGRGRITKNTNTSIGLTVYSTGCTANVKNSFRFEATFLLSENLVPEGE